MNQAKPRHPGIEWRAVEGDGIGAQSYDDWPGTWLAGRVSAQLSAKEQAA